MADWQAQVAENARRYGELSDRLARASITETSRDGGVRVTVDADGSVADLVLDDRVWPSSMPELAEQIMGCLRRARARIPDLLAQTMAETVGTQDESAALLMADARRKFPPPPPEPVDRNGGWDVDERRIGAAPRDQRPEPPPTPQPVRRPRTTPRPRDDRDDGWDERPVLMDV